MCVCGAAFAQRLCVYQPVGMRAATDCQVQCLQMTRSMPELGMSTQSRETDMEVGRWGEELVYRFLLAHASTDASEKPSQQPPAESACQIEWVNQDFNTSLPFDLRLRQAAKYTAAEV